MPVPLRVPLVAVVGATASGKTGLSLDLAERLGAQIVNTDALAVYRGMDIGTATLPVEQRRGIPHHLLDTLTVREPASVAQFQAMARSVVEGLRARGTPSVLVGGSALYTRAVLDRVDFPGTDPDLRARLEAELAAHGEAALHRRLAAVDPQAAADILPENGRRVVRALEVVELTGKPFRARLPRAEYHYDDAHQVGVRIDRPTLDERIEARVRVMWEAGFPAEVERLLAQGLAGSRTASRAIGYREAIAELNGELGRDEAMERTAARTRRFARRQDAWFERDSRIHWVDFDDPDRVARALEAVLGPTEPDPSQERSGAAGPARSD